MKSHRLMTIMVIFTVFCAVITTTHRGAAVDGFPGSAQFGYGARLDIQGQGIQESIDLASGLNFSWLLVKYDWSLFWPDPDSQPQYTQLDSIVSRVREKNISLVFSISNPPDWAMSTDGPGLEPTLRLVLDLARRYQGTVQAFELFPDANTVDGWSGSPDPKNFAELLRDISDGLASKDIDVRLIATLSPLLSEDAGDNIPDDIYLRELYANDWQDGNYILGIHYPKVTGNPLTQPVDGDGPVLRHYEDLRKILVKHHDEHRKIWITGFAWPGELAEHSNPTIQQTRWLFTAYRLLTAQLYIGAAFFEQINPSSSSSSVSSLLLPDTSLHPACSKITQMTDLNNIVIPDPSFGAERLSSIDKGFSK